MKFTVLILIVCVLGQAAAVAAEPAAKGEFFGGYQYTRIGGAGGIDANGWNAALTGNVSRWFGVTADFSAVYKSIGGINANAYTYTFGPKLSARGDRVTPFAHALLGGFHASAGLQGLSASTNGFAMMVGGGVDVKVTKHVAVRVIQPDWIIWRTQGLTENARISTGLVFQF